MDRAIHDLPSSELDKTDSSYRPESATGPPSSTGVGPSSDDLSTGGDEATLRVSRSEVVRLQFSSNPAMAQEFLEELPVTKAGVCLESTLKPSKEGGYVQLSFGGANKFCTLGEMLGWAAGKSLSGDLQISHRCNRPKCTIPSHICLECPPCNNGRKNCLVLVDCPHDGCQLKILVCPHTPSCITDVEGYETWEEFLEWGCH
jgi:hypothetical protein